MKYGQQLEKESQPGWSLHNIDYNSLKHHIKVHTTQDQATAIAIPGRGDSVFSKFEDDLFAELCRQHDRVDLFATSKADEILRRLQHISSEAQQILLRCAASAFEPPSLKHQRRVARYERALLQCGDDIRALQCFVAAQVVAFRKILKKYRKWTGSPLLSGRFRDTVLSHPKSFTRNDFSHLQARYDEILATNPAGTLLTRRNPGMLMSHPPDLSPRPDARLLVPPSPATMVNVNALPHHKPSRQQGYWNEYDNGSDAGHFDHTEDGYAIYVNPEEGTHFPGISTLGALFTSPVKMMRSFIASKRLDAGAAEAAALGEQNRLLPHDCRSGSYGSQDNYSVNSPSRNGSGALLVDAQVGSDGESTSGRILLVRGYPNERDPRAARLPPAGYASSLEEDCFPSGYATIPAASLSTPSAPTRILLPSIASQRIALRHRESLLVWATWGAFLASAVMLGVVVMLVETSRRKWRAEVDAGAAIGVVSALGFACTALGTTLARRETIWIVHKTLIGFAFAACCVLAGIELVLVAGNTAMDGG